MRRLPYLWLDVFAEQPFAGNGLCVILDATSLSDEEMQAIARETNLSETSFVLPPTQPGADYRMRIFTPGGELPFAGHPTLGTAWALVLTGEAPSGRLVQETLSGLTPVDVALDLVVMQAPPPRLLHTVDTARLSRIVGVPVQAAELIESGVRHLVARVATVQALSLAAPQTPLLRDLSEELGCLGIYLFSLANDPTVHARARLFAPLYGIPEDPATGSAAAPLAAFLHRHELLPSHGGAFWYEQGVEMGRPSRLWVRVTDAPDGPTVRVGGQVAQVSRGEFLLP